MIPPHELALVYDRYAFTLWRGDVTLARVRGARRALQPGRVLKEVLQAELSGSDSGG